MQHGSKLVPDRELMKMELAVLGARFPRLAAWGWGSGLYGVGASGRRGFQFNSRFGLWFWRNLAPTPQGFHSRYGRRDRASSLLSESHIRA